MTIAFFSLSHNAQTCRATCAGCRGAFTFAQNREGKPWQPALADAMAAAGWLLADAGRGYVCSRACLEPPPAPRPRVPHELRCANSACSANCWVDGRTPQEDAAQAAVQGWVQRAPVQRGVDRIEHVHMGGRLFCRANCARDTYLRSGKAEGRDSLKDEFWLDGSGNPRHPKLAAAEAGKVAGDAMPSEVQLACRVCPSTINTPTGPRATAFLEASGWSLVHGEAFCSQRCFAIGARVPGPDAAPKPAQTTKNCALATCHSALELADVLEHKRADFLKANGWTVACGGRWFCGHGCVKKFQASPDESWTPPPPAKRVAKRSAA